MYKSENMALFRQINAALLIPMGNKTKTERTLKTRSTRWTYDQVDNTFYCKLYCVFVVVFCIHNINSTSGAGVSPPLLLKQHYVEICILCDLVPPTVSFYALIF